MYSFSCVCTLAFSRACTCVEWLSSISSYLRFPSLQPTCHLSQPELTKPSSAPPKHCAAPPAKHESHRELHVYLSPAIWSPFLSPILPPLLSPYFFLLQPHWPPILCSGKCIPNTELCAFWELFPRAKWLTPSLPSGFFEGSPPRKGCPQTPYQSSNPIVIL